MHSESESKAIAGIIDSISGELKNGLRRECMWGKMLMRCYRNGRFYISEYVASIGFRQYEELDGSINWKIYLEPDPNQGPVADELTSTCVDIVVGEATKKKFPEFRMVSGSDSSEVVASAVYALLEKMFGQDDHLFPDKVDMIDFVNDTEKFCKFAESADFSEHDVSFCVFEPFSENIVFFSATRRGERMTTDGIGPNKKTREMLESYMVGVFGRDSVMRDNPEFLVVPIDQSSVMNMMDIISL